MKKINFWFMAVALVFAFVSCKKDNNTPELVIKARFTVTNDTIDGFKVNIHNDSENATSFEWSFGDNTAVVVKSDSVFTYSYATAGTYQITLTAKSGTKTATMTNPITIAGKTFKQFLAGTAVTGKSWKLEYNAGVVMLNPANYGDWWYSWTKNHGFPIDMRNTVRHNEYIFKPNGSFEFKSNGFTIRPGFLFGAAPALQGWADSVSWTPSAGPNCSAWGNNASLTFSLGTAAYYADCKLGKILLNGAGGHLGPIDDGTINVVGEPATQTFYEVYHYADGGDQPDTLVLFTPWGGNENGVGVARGAQIGRITLVAYKNVSQIPADEIEVIVGKPLETHDIADNFDTPGTMTWVQDNSPALFDENFDNPFPGGINTSAKVAKYVRGTMDYANMQFELPFRMDLSTRNVFKVKVYIDPAAAVKTVSLKLQDTKMGGNAWQTQTEVKLQTLDSGSWIELTFDFSSVATNVNYDKIVLQFGDEGANKGDGTFYFDDFRLL